MQLEKIKLFNFRQFYSEQEILFSTDSDKNVTLIHAENGVGKTTLLNALLWCFYGETTAEFELADLLVSNQAKEEGIYRTSVEVTFIDDSKRFSVKRELDQEYKNESFQAYEIVGGNFQRLGNPQVFIESVIPKEMSKYFFFDGEYAQTFASSNNKRAVKTAVESMLGCNIAIQALNDLKAIETSLNKEIGEVSKGNTQANIFQKKIDTSNEMLTTKKNQMSQRQNDKTYSEEVRQTISDELRATKGADTIQLEKDNLHATKRDLDQERKKLESQETKWIYTDSCGLISTMASKACMNVVELAKVEGNLPSKIADTFVNDILVRKICICGTHFQDGSAESVNIGNLRKEAGTATMNDRLVAIRSRLDRLQETENRCMENYKTIVDSMTELDAKISETEIAINECDAKLAGNEIREVADKQNAVKREEKKIDEANQDIGRLGLEITTLIEEINTATTKRDKYLTKTSGAAEIQRKLLLVQAAHESLTMQLEEYRTNSRSAIEEKVNEILTRTARRNYKCSIDEQFNLDMHYVDTGQLVAKSKGENQLLSLAFIASLVSFSADRRNQQNEILKPGTIAPLMLDSPFGELDPQYRESTAAFLPSSTGQVILLLSQTQGDGAVIDVLKKYVGEESILISEVTSDQNDKPNDFIEVNGKTVASSVYNAEKNRTLIQRVE